MRSIFEISARTACRRYKLDPDVWWEFVVERVMSTNAICIDVQSGYNRTYVAHYSEVMAARIYRYLKSGGSPESIQAMSFLEIWNFGDN